MNRIIGEKISPKEGRYKSPLRVTKSYESSNASISSSRASSRASSRSSSRASSRNSSRSSRSSSTTRNQSTSRSRTPERRSSILGPFNYMFIDSILGDLKSKPNLSIRDLISILNQLIFLKMHLTENIKAQRMKEEKEILNCWHTVNSLEEEAFKLTMKENVALEIIKIHNQLLNMNGIIEQVNSNIAPIFEIVNNYITMKSKKSKSNFNEDFSIRTKFNSELSFKLLRLKKSVEGLIRQFETRERSLNRPIRNEVARINTIVGVQSSQDSHDEHQNGSRHSIPLSATASMDIEDPTGAKQKTSMKRISSFIEQLNKTKEINQLELKNATNATNATKSIEKSNSTTEPNTTTSIGSQYMNEEDSIATNSKNYSENGPSDEISLLTSQDSNDNLAEPKNENFSISDSNERSAHTNEFIELFRAKVAEKKMKNKSEQIEKEQPIAQINDSQTQDPPHLSQSEHSIVQLTCSDDDLTSNKVLIPSSEDSISSSLDNPQPQQILERDALSVQSTPKDKEPENEFIALLKAQQQNSNQENTSASISDSNNIDLDDIQLEESPHLNIEKIPSNEILISGNKPTSNESTLSSNEKDLPLNSSTSSCDNETTCIDESRPQIESAHSPNDFSHIRLEANYQDSESDDEVEFGITLNPNDISYESIPSPQKMAESSPHNKALTDLSSGDDAFINSSDILNKNFEALNPVNSGDRQECSDANLPSKAEIRHSNNENFNMSDYSSDVPGHQEQEPIHQNEINEDQTKFESTSSKKRVSFNTEKNDIFSYELQSEYGMSPVSEGKHHDWNEAEDSRAVTTKSPDDSTEENEAFNSHDQQSFQAPRNSELQNQSGQTEVENELPKPIQDDLNLDLDLVHNKNQDHNYYDDSQSFPQHPPPSENYSLNVAQSEKRGSSTGNYGHEDSRLSNTTFDHRQRSQSAKESNSSSSSSPNSLPNYRDWDNMSASSSPGSSIGNGTGTSSSNKRFPSLFKRFTQSKSKNSLDLNEIQDNHPPMRRASSEWSPNSQLKNSNSPDLQAHQVKQFKPANSPKSLQLSSLSSKGQNRFNNENNDKNKAPIHSSSTPYNRPTNGDSNANHEDGKKTKRSLSSKLFKMFGDSSK